MGSIPSRTARCRNRPRHPDRPPSFGVPTHVITDREFRGHGCSAAEGDRRSGDSVGRVATIGGTSSVNARGAGGGGGCAVQTCAPSMRDPSTSREQLQFHRLPVARQALSARRFDVGAMRGRADNIVAARSGPSARPVARDRAVRMSHLLARDNARDPRRAHEHRDD